MKMADASAIGMPFLMAQSGCLGKVDVSARCKGYFATKSVLKDFTVNRTQDASSTSLL